MTGQNPLSVRIGHLIDGVGSPESVNPRHGKSGTGDDFLMFWLRQPHPMARLPGVVAPTRWTINAKLAAGDPDRAN